MRSFTIVDFPEAGKTYGRYKGKMPKNAAQKAFSSLSRKINLKNTNDKNLLIFTIRETTNNSDNKLYKYIGTRIILDNPIKRNIGGKEVVYRYKNMITQYENFIKN